MLRGLVKNKMERVNKEISEAETAEEKVKAYRQGMSVPAGAVIFGKYEIVEGQLGNCPVTWMSQDFFPVDRAILYLHGGGYIGGSVLFSRNGAASLAVEFGSKLAAIDYRLAPEHPWPAALDDALAAYEQMLSDGMPAEGIVIVGESAGAGLALATVLAAKDKGLAMPAAVIALSPWCDLTMSNITMRANRRRDIMLTNELLTLASSLYAGDNDRTNPYISPIFGDFSGFPPLLIQVAAEELLLGEIIDTAGRAAEQSENEVQLEIYEGVWHVWQTMDEIVPEARQAVEKMGAFVKRYLPEIQTEDSAANKEEDKGADKSTGKATGKSTGRSKTKQDKADMV